MLDKPTKHRLIIDFDSVEAIREFADAMADRTPLPADAIVREWETTDDTLVRTRKYIWARRDADVEDQTVWPSLSPKIEAQALRARLAALEES